MSMTYINVFQTHTSLLFLWSTQLKTAVIWLSEDSPSAAWTSTDIAWEEDLEPISEEAY